MDQQYIVPRVAFVINLAPSESRKLSPARVQHLIHLFQSQRVSATWAISDASMAQLLRDQATAAVSQHVALNMHALRGEAKTSSRGFTQQLSQELARISAILGRNPTAVLGDSTRLRSRIVLLSQLGIETIIADCSENTANLRPRPLPCGLWQLVPNVRLPRTRLIDRLTRRSPSVREMIASGVEGTTLIGISAARVETLSARGMQSFEKFLQEVSWAASRGQVEQSNLAEILVDLRRRSQVKPQRSIMQAA